MNAEAGLNAGSHSDPRAVSVPIGWNELDDIARSDSMSLQAVIGRLAHMDSDPWAEIGDVEQSITKQVWKHLG